MTDAAEVWYCLPLVRSAGSLIEATAVLGGEPLPAEEFEGYLKRNHRLTEDSVELGGRRYIASVYEPLDPADFSYVVVNHERIPRGERLGPEINEQDRRLYLEALRHALALSEAIVPSQSIYLRSEFMIPTFAELTEDGRSVVRDRTWADFKDRRRVVLLGSAGAGKTSCLRRLAVELADAGETEPVPLPVYVQLRGLGSDLDLVRAIRRTLSTHATGLAEQAVLLCQAGQLVLMLDGLDEVPADTRSALAVSIKKLASEHPRLGIILSSRNSAYDWSLDGFLHLELKPFAPTQIEEWACQRMYSTNKNAGTFFFMHLSSHPQLLGITSNPLLLSITAHEYECNGVLPTDRARLLSSYVMALVERWDQARSIKRTHVPWAATSDKVAALCRSAYTLRTLERSSFETAEFLQWERDLVTTWAPETMLEGLRQETSLLVFDRSRRTWTFAHDLFVDYLAARYLVELTDDTGPVLLETLAHGRWTEIWSIACGITQNATHLLQLVTESKLREPQKAVLLATALSQRLSLERSTLDRCVGVIVSVLEESLQACSCKVAKSDDHVHWSAQMLAMHEDESLESRCSSLALLLPAVYGARSGNAARALHDDLLGSKVPALAAFAECLVVDGRYQSEVDARSGKISVRVDAAHRRPLKRP